MKTTKVETVSLKWMACPKIDTVHPGLAYIWPLDELVVAKQKDALHDIIGKPGISYTIFNKEGQKVFLAVHEKHCRKFDLKIFNIYGNEVIQVKKPKFCLTRIFVWAPPGNYVGSVSKGRPCGKIYLVKDRCGEVILKLQARGFFQVIYDVLSDRDHVGILAPKWKLEVLNVKNFGVSFPIDMDVGYKAVLLGACFLLIA
ncbi:hypothetical protein O3G_MSEX011074 [Manduca sexta]|uniref:Phospholipid scramblase n=1 Tax=Manduca sexta TaxID=7130 RepID=A0A922CUJ8_MANSE|nr:hypothetical protein O3G_MSEX011074 [Manduca sexta]